MQDVGKCILEHLLNIVNLKAWISQYCVNSLMKVREDRYINRKLRSINALVKLFRSRREDSGDTDEASIQRHFCTLAITIGGFLNSLAHDQESTLLYPSGGGWFDEKAHA